MAHCEFTFLSRECEHLCNSLHGVRPSASPPSDGKAGYSSAEGRAQVFSNSARGSCSWFFLTTVSLSPIGTLSLIHAGWIHMPPSFPVALPFFITRGWPAHVKYQGLRIRFQQLLLSSKWSSLLMFLRLFFPTWSCLNLWLSSPLVLEEQKFLVSRAWRPLHLPWIPLILSLYKIFFPLSVIPLLASLTFPGSSVNDDVWEEMFK